MMVMPVTMAVPVIVAVPVIMVVIVSMIVIVAMGMRVAVIVILLPVGTAFGIKRRGHFIDARAQPFQHVDDDMIVADQDAVMLDLGRQMAIAEMPGEASQRGRVRCRYRNQRLVSGADFDNTAIIEQKAVAIAQDRRFRQIEQKLQTAIGGQGNAAAIAVVKAKRDAIGNPGGVELSARADGGRVQHAMS